MADSAHPAHNMQPDNAFRHKRAVAASPTAPDQWHMTKGRPLRMKRPTLVREAACYSVSGNATTAHGHAHANQPCGEERHGAWLWYNGAFKSPYTVAATEFSE